MKHVNTEHTDGDHKVQSDEVYAKPLKTSDDQSQFNDKYVKPENIIFP